MREKKKKLGRIREVRKAERCDVWGLGPFWESTFGGERLQRCVPLAQGREYLLCTL
jgi:hypothetical protein